MNATGSDFLIGIDGGGTGCRVAIARAGGGVIARAEAGPANATSDLRGCVANVRMALEQALVSAGLTLAQVAGAPAHAGLAGVISAEVGTAVAQALPLSNLSVTEDRETMVAGALGGRDGALAAIGTGSFVAAQRGDVMHGVGGWGWQLSDEASGAWLGQAALRRALAARDGMAEQSDLLAALLDDMGGALGIVAFAGRAGPAEYAALAPRVVAAALADDAAAVALMRTGADWITRALVAVGHRDGDPLCLTGGLGPRYSAYLPPDLTRGLVEPVGTALDGALLLARQRAGS